METEEDRSSFLATTVHLLKMNGESYRLKRSRKTHNALPTLSPHTPVTSPS